MSNNKSGGARKTKQRAVKAAAIVEYVMLVGLVSVGSITAITGVGAKIDGGFKTASTKIADATGFLTPAGASSGPAPGNTAPVITSMFFNSNNNLANGGAGAIYLSDADGDTLSVSFTGPGGMYFTPFSNGADGYNSLDIGGVDIPPGVPITVKALSTKVESFRFHHAKSRAV